MKKNLKEIFIHLSQWFSRKKYGALILMYHSVGNNQAFGTVTKETFLQHICYLNKSNRTIVPVSEIVRALKLQQDVQGLVAISFDDGYQDFYNTVFPVIKENNIPVTLFVVTGKESLITSEGYRFELLNQAQLQEISQSVLVEICSHTVTHPNLAMLSIQETQKEIVDSYETLSSITVSPRILAYPRGKYSQTTIEVLKSLLWEAAVTVRSDYITINTPLFRLPRVSIDSTTSFRYFKSIVTGKLSFYYRIKTWIS